MRKHRFSLTLSAATIAATIAATLTLSACGDKAGPDQSAGQKVDAAIGSVEKKADTVGADVKQGAETVKDAATTAIDNAADTARDAAITTQVHADLARDPELSTLKIDVDTVGGKVLLKGTAPNDAAKTRAAAKAQAVAGVVSVDNQLRIGG